MSETITNETTTVRATDAAASLIEALRAEFGAVSLHISGSYGMSVVCLPEDELKLGARDVGLGEVAGASVYMMTSEIDLWRGSALTIDVARGVGPGFSLEGPRRVHFTLRKRANPAKRVWDANDYIAPTRSW